jgi:hypothetical protein
MPVQVYFNALDTNTPTHIFSTALKKKKKKKNLTSRQRKGRVVPNILEVIEELKILGNGIINEVTYPGRGS